MIRFSFHFGCLASLLFTVFTVAAQPADSLNEDLDPVLMSYPYDTDLLTADFHRGRREALRAVLPDSGVAVFFSAPRRNHSRDIWYEYHQDPNFYYLTGLREPDAMLIVSKDTIMIDTIKTNELLFMRDKDPISERWDGRRLGLQGGKETLGFTKVMENKDFADLYVDFHDHKMYYLGPENDMRDDPNNRGDLFSLVKHFKHAVDGHPRVTEGRELGDMMAGLRQKKLPEEMLLLEKAISTTCLSLEELMKALHPGMYEYEAEAIVEYVMKREGAENTGFPSIVAGGENACIMHYTSNRKPLERGELLVVDIGAQYHGYTADVTRTLPVSGSFSEEEALLYDAVLEAQQAAIKAAQKGNRFWAPHYAARRVIARRLLQYGIIKNWWSVRHYFTHGTSHYLGLDVHDPGIYEPLKAGEVITVEPGIYIPEGADCDPRWWNIGIRIEDDLLITEDGPVVLSDCVPKTREAIEAIMQETSLLIPPRYKPRLSR